MSLNNSTAQVVLVVIVALFAHCCALITLFPIDTSLVLVFSCVSLSTDIPYCVTCSFVSF